MKKEKTIKERKTRLKLSKKGKIFFTIVFLLILMGCSYFFLFDQSIRSIFIYDNSVLSDYDIISLSGLNSYPNFYLTSSSSIEEKLVNNPYIENVKIKKTFFHEIHIYIKEYVPLVYDSSSSKVILNNKEYTDNNYDLNLPVLVNYVPDTKLNTFIEKFNLIDSTIRDKISEIKYDPNSVDEDRFLLYMNDDNYVYITLTKMDLLDKYNETITKLEGKKGILYLDSGNYFEIK